MNVQDMESTLDLSHLVSDIDNIALDLGFGGFLLLKRDNNIYEVHTLFDTKKPKNYKEKVQEALDYAFTETPAVELTSWAYEGNFPAIRLMKAFGMKPIEKQSDKQIYSIFFDDWAEKFKTQEDRLELAKRMAHNPLKAVGCYNRWASENGVPEAEIIATDPLIVNLQTCVVHIRNDYSIEVLT